METKKRRVGNRHYSPLAPMVSEAKIYAAEGWSVRKIAKHMGVSKSWVHDNVKKA